MCPLPSCPPAQGKVSSRRMDPPAVCPQRTCPQACPQEGCVTSLHSTYSIQLSPGHVCPQMAAAPGHECHPPVHDPGHTCPPAMCVPTGPCPAVPSRRVVCSRTFLEPACQEVITPHWHRLRGGHDKQQRPAIGDPALARKVSPDPLSPLGDRSRGSITHVPPSLARPWQEVAPGGPRTSLSLGERTPGLGGGKGPSPPFCDPELS